MSMSNFLLEIDYLERLIRRHLVSVYLKGEAWREFQLPNANRILAHSLFFLGNEIAESNPYISQLIIKDWAERNS